MVIVEFRKSGISSSSDENLAGKMGDKAVTPVSGRSYGKTLLGAVAIAAVAYVAISGFQNKLAQASEYADRSKNDTQAVFDLSLTANKTLYTYLNSGKDRLVSDQNDLLNELFSNITNKAASAHVYALAAAAKLKEASSWSSYKPSMPW